MDLALMWWRRCWPCRGDRKPQVTADPRVNARKGIRMEQASHEVQAQGRKADIVCEAPLAQCTNINSPFPLTAPRITQGSSPCPGSSWGSPPPCCLREAGSTQQRMGCSLKAGKALFPSVVKPRNILPRPIWPFPSWCAPNPKPLPSLWEHSPKLAVFPSFPSSQDTWNFLQQAPATPHGDSGQVRLPRPQVYCPGNQNNQTSSMGLLGQHAQRQHSHQGLYVLRMRNNLFQQNHPDISEEKQKQQLSARTPPRRL